MKTVTLPEAVLFGTMIGLGVTGFLLAATVCVACAFVNKE